MNQKGIFKSLLHFSLNFINRIITMNKELPRTLKHLAVEVNVPVRELVKLYSRLGFKFPNKPSVKLDPQHIKLILPLVQEYLSQPLPISKRTRNRLKKSEKVSKRKKRASGKKKMSQKIQKEIMLSVDGFGVKVPKKAKKKSKFKSKKPVIISTPMKS